MRAPGRVLPFVIIKFIFITRAVRACGFVSKLMRTPT